MEYQSAVFVDRPLGCINYVARSHGHLLERYAVLHPTPKADESLWFRRITTSHKNLLGKGDDDRQTVCHFICQLSPVFS